MTTCKYCKHFQWKLSSSRNWGECLNPKVLSLIRLSLRHVELDNIGRKEVNEYHRIQFDEDEFGCIHFEGSK